jgi:hypothetical protein
MFYSAKPDSATHHRARRFSSWRREAKGNKRETFTSLLLVTMMGVVTTIITIMTIGSRHPR